MNVVPVLVALIGVLVVFGFVLIAGLKKLYYVCQPSEALVFSGRRHTMANGVEIGYRVIRGGSAIRIPLIETVDRVDLRNMSIEVTVRNAYSKGGIPLTVQGVANVKIPGELPLLHNALERFLGRSRDDIMRIARETLEGNLRGVLATLTPEQVNRDKEAFAAKLTEEAGHDLNRLGLVLDTLNIQNVSDEVGYLGAIGRTRSAQVRRDAQLAEANAHASGAEVKWKSFMEGELANIESAIEVARKDNELRVADARTRREALIAEQLAEVQAMTAQAEAEIKMQAARIEQVKLRLEADVVQPAEAKKEESVARAKADAAKIIEQGKATAKVLEDLARSYRATGGKGRDVLLMQKLIPIFEQVTSTIGHLKVDRLTVLGSETNGAGSNGAASLARGLVSANEQVKAALGVDVAKVVKDKLSDHAPPPAAGAPVVSAPAHPTAPAKAKAASVPPKAGSVPPKGPSPYGAR